MRRWWQRWLLVLIGLVLWSTAYLHVAQNWRWLIAGDTLGYVATGYQWAAGEAPANPWAQDRGVLYIGWPEAAWFNWPMVVIAPTAFWHHVGKLGLVLAGVGALGLYFWLLVGRWAILPIALLLLNYYWVATSLNHMAHQWSHITAGLAMAGAIAVVRWPRRWWGLGVLIVGVGTAPWFSRIAWMEAAIAGAIGWYVLTWGRRLVLLAGTVALAWPILTQVAVLRRNSLQAMGYQWPSPIARLLHDWQITTMLLWDTPPWHHLLCGAWVVWPFYALGAGLAVVATGRWVWRRWAVLRLHVGWTVVLAQLLLVTAGIAMTQPSQYAHPSQNRAYHIVPYQSFLTAVPVMWIGQWSPWLGVLGATALIAVTARDLRKLDRCPSRSCGGGNVWDALVEVTQDYGPVNFVTARADLRALIQRPGELLNRMHGLHRTVWPSAVPIAEAPIVCRLATEPVTPFPPGERVPLRASPELLCVWSHGGLS